MIKKSALVVFISLIFVLILMGTTYGTNSTLYVDVNSGTDSGDGSHDHPWRTINHAANQVETGDTVLILEGNYIINNNIYITTSGNKTNPVTFKGVGNDVTIDASGLDGSSYDKRDAIFIENANYVNIENLEIKNAFRTGIRVSGSDYVTIKNVTCHDNGNWGIFTDFSNYLIIENCDCYGSVNEHGIYTSNSGDNPIIRGNKIHDNHACGLHMNGDASMGGDGVISNALIENNVIYNNGVGGGSGINCDGVTDSIIRNNLLYNNHANGISLYKIDGGAESNNNQAYHNTVIVASDGRWALNLKGGSSQNKIYNNILLNKNLAHGSITTDSITGLGSDYNIITTNAHPATPDDESTYLSFSQWQGLGFDQHSTQATNDQLFTNPSGNDYTLKTGSPAVDKGTSQHTYSEDIQGTRRPQGKGCDIGAYEKTSTLIQPSDLAYMGAFRLPDTPGGMGWEWAGVEMGALTYYPNGDSEGSLDGYSGSLYGTGNDQLKYISEISIPAPIISVDKNPDDLNTAQTLQEFTNVLGDKLEEMELPKVGLSYLAKQGNQTSDKLYYCFGQHIQDEERNPSHGWFELNLSNPQLAGDWKIDNLLNYLTTYYLFSISKEWADTYTPGKYLVTGRFRDGGQGSQGPTLFAYGPWNEGNPPSSETELSYIPLLQYSSVTDPESHVMDNYAHSDEWNGGSWLTSNGKSSVIFAGTKGIGYTWYGFSDGTEWPTSGEGPFPPVPIINPTFYGEDLRGWWSESFQAQILFYDPADLAAVAHGTMQSYEPQPYATLNIDPYLFNLQDSQQKDRVGAVTFDSERGILYVTEPLADGDKTIIHVWKLKSSTDLVSPSVVTINPVNNTVNVPRNIVITINFSEPIKTGTMWMELKSNSGTVIPITKSISGNVLTITHSALLAPGTQYTLGLHTGCVMDFEGNNLASKITSFATTTDGTAPTATSSDPANNALNVPQNKVIKITFNEPLLWGNYWIELKNNNGTIIPTNKSITGNILTITPPSVLAPGTKYNICLHTGCVNDYAGNPLAGVFKSFTTTTSADITPPTITTTDPTNNAINVPRNKIIKVTFNEPLKWGTFWIELKNSAGTIIPLTKSITNNILTITPSTPLTANTKYMICMHTGSVTDYAGNPLAGTTMSFTTITGTGPTVTSSDPTNNAMNVNKNKVIKITFNEPLKWGTFWIELKNSTGTAISIAKSITTNVLTVTPSTLLTPNTKYTISLHTGCVSDYEGNPLAAKVINFTTGNT